MMPLALALAVLLVLIAALHAYWGIGGIWPGNDQASCARAVVGFRGVAVMPSPVACFAVTAMILAASLLALALGGFFATPFERRPLAGAALFVGLVFLGRGIAGFTPAWRRLAPEMPFASLDIRYYSPLCLLIGAGFTVLAVEGFAG